MRNSSSLFFKANCTYSRWPAYKISYHPIILRIRVAYVLKNWNCSWVDTFEWSNQTCVHTSSCAYLICIVCCMCEFVVQASCHHVPTLILFGSRFYRARNFKVEPNSPCEIYNGSAVLPSRDCELETNDSLKIWNHCAMLVIPIVYYIFALGASQRICTVFRGPTIIWG